MAILFGQTGFILGQFNVMPSNSEIARSTETIEKVSAIQEHINSVIQMCDRRIDLGEKELEPTCNSFMKVFDSQMRQFLMNNSHTLSLVLYPKTINVPSPVDFTTSNYTSSAVALDYLLLLRQLSNIYESCGNSDTGIVKLCISLSKDQLAKFQNIESDGSQQIAQIMNVNRTG